MSEISQELAQRMAKFIRAIIESGPRSTTQDRVWDLGHAIVALLPDSVDPLLIEAREIVKVIAQIVPTDYSCHEIDAGKWDDRLLVRSTLAGLKRGHALGVIEAAARGQA